MTTRDTNWPDGTPCWVDLAVDDFAKAEAFYSGLFGWTVDQGPPEFGGYAVCSLGGRTVAGLTPKFSPDQPSVWTTYLATDDLDATLVRVRDNGGQVMGEAMDIAGMGRMAIATDPGGAFVGFWQGGSHTGFQLCDEPGSVTWNENLTRAWSQNQDFYAAVFGYEYDDMSDGNFQYAAFKLGGRPAGGIGVLAGEALAGVPPHWSTYFKVADIDAAVDQVRHLGGTVMREPWDTEFGMMASVSDDQGAPFMVMADRS